MSQLNFEDKLFIKYLDILGLKRQRPSPESLKEIIKVHASKIPFENISKLYYRNRLNLKELIDFELYLDGIERFNFGGTCYSINYYLNRLLDWLGYDIKLCGADMSNPDVHIVNIINIKNREFLVDLGYAAPFSEPIPLDLQSDYSIRAGEKQYIVKPRKDRGNSRVELYQSGILRHGYVIKPEARNIKDFQTIISNSFEENATFMNTLLITRFVDNCFFTIHNMTITECNGIHSNSHLIESIYQLTSIIENRLGIPKRITTESISNLSMIMGAWS